MSNKKEAEDVVIEFENQSGDKYKICMSDYSWMICKYRAFLDQWYIVAEFVSIEDAEACAETLKRSV
jgi:hypothetical protein